MVDKISKPLVLIATGGTIGAIGRGPLDFVNYGAREQYRTAQQMLENLPESTNLPPVKPIDLMERASSALEVEDWLTVLTATRRLIETEDPLGIVVTHGTATMEETAYFLHLALPTEVPIVLVGSQRPGGALGSDAEYNLLQALRVAATEESHGMGVLVVVGDQIFSARDVRKSDTYGLGAFASTNHGSLGCVGADGNVEYYRAPLVRRRAWEATLEFAAGAGRSLPSVGIVPSYVGADGAVIDYLVDRGAAGIVVAGLPPGVPSGGQAAAIRRATDAGLPVVVSSRSYSGRVIRKWRLDEIGAVAANDLTPEKARIAMMLALATNSGPNWHELFRWL